MKKITIICFALLVSIASFGQSDDQKKNEKPMDYDFEELSESLERMGEALENMFKNDSLFQQFDMKLKEFNFDNYFKDLKMDEKYFDNPEMQKRFEELGKNIENMFKEFNYGDFEHMIKKLQLDFDSLDFDFNYQEKKSEEKKEKKLKKI